MGPVVDSWIEDVGAMDVDDCSFVVAPVVDSSIADVDVGWFAVALAVDCCVVNALTDEG